MKLSHAPVSIMTCNVTWDALSREIGNNDDLASWIARQNSVDVNELVIKARQARPDIAYAFQQIIRKLAPPAPRPSATALSGFALARTLQTSAQPKRRKLHDACDVFNHPDKLIELQHQLERDVYAANTTKVMKSNENTWREICAAANCGILISRESLTKASIAFLAGGYKNPQGYFNWAWQNHLNVTGKQPDPELKRLLKQYLRSIRRNAGETTSKNAFPVIDYPWRDLINSRPTDEQYFAGCIIVGCWFMLRGTELRNLRRQHIQINTTNKIIELQLPQQKTDQIGRGCRRRITCVCKSFTIDIPCPFHLGLNLTHAFDRRRQDPAQLEPAFFLSDNSLKQLSHAELVHQMNLVATRLGEQTMDRNPDNTLKPRFGQHTMRVSGAQLLTHIQIDTHLIQLLGRWGSDAIKFYVQDAQANTHSITGQRRVLPITQQSTESPLLHELSQQVKELRDSFTNLTHPFVRNEDAKPKCLHRRQPADCTANSIPVTWAATCGWPYGNKNIMFFASTNEALLDETRLCTRCFASEFQELEPGSDSDYSVNNSDAEQIDSD